MDRPKNLINYFYFGAFFLFLLFLASASIYTKKELGAPKIFFFLYALGQASVEIALFIFISSLLRPWKFLFFPFIGTTFVLLFFHSADFLMDRFLDLSAWQTLNIFIFNESFDNFIYLLDASGLAFWAWGVIFALIFSLPLIGILAYKITDKLSSKKPFSLNHSFFLQLFLCVPSALLFWDFSTSKILGPDDYTSFVKSLPWQFTFLSPEHTHLAINNSFKAPSYDFLTEIAKDQTTLDAKPNIYLFIAESLREDFITQEIAPHIHRFKQNAIHFETSLSNGNGTQLSWFSIFYSQFAYLWHTFQTSWQKGSPALHLLKKWGYQIRVYSSAQHGYYKMDQLLFGPKNQLVDSYQTFHHAYPLQAADSDAAALSKMQKDIRENPDLKEGQVFILFWDGTHFDYNWPKDWAPKFTPYAKHLAYFQAFQSKQNIELLKNRYRNAIHYLDNLFGSFLKDLPDKNESIVIFTGDHGEEFFDHGHLLHNSHLTREQMQVPLYFKFGQSTRLPTRKIASQVDIFPSIIDYLGGKVQPFFVGHSIFQEQKNPFALISRFNAGATPYEFCIHNGKYKLIAQFRHPHDLFNNQELRIVSLRTGSDKTIPKYKKELNVWIEREFRPALEQLFK